MNICPYGNPRSPLPSAPVRCSPSYGRVLEYGIPVSIGKTKIYQFDILTVFGDHYVTWFQITVDDLVAVQVLKGIAKFEEDFLVTGLVMKSLLR